MAQKDHKVSIYFFLYRASAYSLVLTMYCVPASLVSSRKERPSPSKRVEPAGSRQVVPYHYTNRHVSRREIITTMRLGVFPFIES